MKKFLAAVVLVLSLPALPASPAPPALPALPALPAPPAQQAKPNRRLFAPRDLGLIEPPDRDQWQKPEQIMDSLSIADGSVVAELGAAGGWFTLWLARRVGPNGIVYAEDIQPQMLEEIRQRVQRENLHNVQPILGTPSDPRLPSGLDAALISDAFHEMDDPTDRTLVVTLLKNVARALKPNGVLGIADYKPGGGGPGPSADQRVDPERVIAAAREAGLQLVQREDVPPFIFVLKFAKATGR
ncbi:MAG: class I SAM-dependent methyltransferase [Acidobacteria bacterium]|nr:class I SAM-dependent methyltransferase [Acidobacteriota bacterium]